MRNPYLSILRVSFFLLITLNSYARIFPIEGAKLNYRMVGFSFPAMENCSSYELLIAPGNITDVQKFVPQITLPMASNRLIAQVPDFGAEYTWRIRYIFGDNRSSKSELHHFSTLSMPQDGSREIRLKVTQRGEVNKQYVLVDGMKALYDMDGNPIWFIPQLDNLRLPGNDLKYTPQHTITLIYGPNTYEIDYNGKVLWKGPDMGPKTKARKVLPAGVVSAPYHHEFYRLANGHYMALVNIPESDEATNKTKAKEHNGRHQFFQSTTRNRLYEFDEAGKVVWSWNSVDYLKHSDIGHFYADTYNLWHEVFMNSHENSFYFDEKNKAIYLSYASFNRVVKISYPSGKVVNVYGHIYDAATAKALTHRDRMPPEDTIQQRIFANGMLSGQHCGSKTKNGYLLFYNNMLNSLATPQVVILKESDSGYAAGLQKLWTFDCPVNSTSGDMRNSGGGCVKELTDGSLFVSMNFPHGTMFIVNKDKKILWSAMPESNDQGNWNTFPSYRANMLDQAELEQLIWSSEDAEGEN